MRSRAFAESIGVKQENVYIYTSPPDLFRVEKQNIQVVHTVTITIRETATITAVDWTTTVIIAAVLLLIGIAVGYAAKRR